MIAEEGRSTLDKDQDEKETQEPTKAPVGGSVLKRVGEVVLGYQKTAAKPPEGKQIHRRRPLPPVPESRRNQADQTPTADSSQ